MNGRTVEFIVVAKLRGCSTDFAEVSSPRVEVPDVEVPHYDPKSSTLLLSVLKRNGLSEFVFFVSSNRRQNLVCDPSGKRVRCGTRGSCTLASQYDFVNARFGYKDHSTCLTSGPALGHQLFVLVKLVDFVPVVGNAKRCTDVLCAKD